MTQIPKPYRNWRIGNQWVKDIPGWWKSFQYAKFGANAKTLTKKELKKIKKYSNKNW